MTKKLYMEISSRSAKTSLRTSILRAASILLAAGLAFGCSGADDPAPPPNARYLADTLVPAYPITEQAAPLRAQTRKWVGRGNRDVCGNPWAIQLAVAGNKVTGEFWLRSIKYEIVGYLDSAGRMDAIPGRKSKYHQNYIGPREMEFNVTFKDGEAIGEHHFSYGRCLTPMRLVPANK